MIVDILEAVGILFGVGLIGLVGVVVFSLLTWEH